MTPLFLPLLRSSLGRCLSWMLVSCLTWCNAATLQADLTDWTVVAYSSPNQFDYADDQQTGNRDADIVGDASHAAFYIRFDNLNTPDLTDGVWWARVRIGSDRPQRGTFDNNLFVGIDADQDGALDLFVGVDNQGSNTRLAIWDPGTGANTSPNTTSIVSPGVYYTPQTAANYSFEAVTTVNDPTATNLDIDADGDNDYFLEFSFDFSQIVQQMSLVSGISMDETTALTMVLATANSDNSLNQDLNGANGGIGSSLTWSELGVLSNPTAFNPVAVPEPAGWLMLAFAGIAGACRRRRQARRSSISLIRLWA